MDTATNGSEQPIKKPALPNRRNRVWPALEVPDSYRNAIPKKVLQFPDIPEHDLKVLLQVTIMSREKVEYESREEFLMPDASLKDCANFALRILKNRVTDWWKRMEQKMIRLLIQGSGKTEIKQIEDAPPNPNETLDAIITEEELAGFDHSAPTLQNIPDDLKKTDADPHASEEIPGN